MGQAKQRGTFQERRRAAILRELPKAMDDIASNLHGQFIRDRYYELTRLLPGQLWIQRLDQYLIRKEAVNAQA